jgi:hypothetical protein
MLRIATLAVLAAAASLLTSAPADATHKKKILKSEVQEGAEHRSSQAYRRGPQVRGFVLRRGGYSYAAPDSINTYGDGRSVYGGGNANFYNRPTQGGPFDSGFFFDSGISPRGGNSPYQN